MLKGVLQFGLTRRPIILLTLLAFIAGGLISFSKLNIEAYPNPAFVGEPLRWRDQCGACHFATASLLKLPPSSSQRSASRSSRARRSVAAGSEIGRRGVAGALFERRRRGPGVHGVCGSFRVLVGREARGLHERLAAAGDDRPLIATAVVLKDDELSSTPARAARSSGARASRTASTACMSCV